MYMYELIVAHLVTVRLPPLHSPTLRVYVCACVCACVCVRVCMTSPLINLINTFIILSGHIRLL